NFLRTFRSASAMILKEPPITRRSKVPDSTKSESSKQKLCGGKRKRRKRQINIEQNNKLGRTRFRRSKAATRGCRGKKTTYFSVSVRRRNRAQRTANSEQQTLSPISEPASIAVAASTESLEGRSPRERPGQKAIGESAAVAVKSDTRTHRTPKALRAKFIERPISFCGSSPPDESARLADFWSAMRPRIPFLDRRCPIVITNRGARR